MLRSGVRILDAWQSGSSLGTTPGAQGQDTPNGDHRRYATEMVARFDRGQNVSTDDRGIRGADHSESMGERGTKSVPRGGQAVRFSEESAPHIEPLGAEGRLAFVHCTNEDSPDGRGIVPRCTTIYPS